jgi:hypothetical protein
MYRNILILSALLILSQGIFSQQNVGEGFNTDQISNNSNILSLTPKPRTNVKIDGTPYISESYFPIKLTSFEDRNFQARYNGVNGDMEVLDIDKGQVFILNKNFSNYEVNFIGLNKKYKVFEYVGEDGILSNDFFIVLTSNNNLKLLKKENVKYYGERVATSTYDKARRASYKRGNDEYYIVIGETNAQPFSTRKKDIAKLFSGSSKQIIDYIKTNKLNTSKDEDLIKVVNYISSL